MLWLRVHIEAGSIEEDGLATALALRHADRRLYRGPHTGAHALFAACRNEASADVAIGIAPADADTAGNAQIRRWLLDADAALWRAPQIPTDAMRWVRFDSQALAQDGDGVSWRNLGLSTALAAGVAIAKRAPQTAVAPR